MRLTGADRADLGSRLAAEYVLGTLKGAARRRFETHLLADPNLRAEVAQWETRLTPLAERLKPITPPDRVWRKIIARIETPASMRFSKQNVPKSSTSAGVWHSIVGSLGFWRGLGLGTSALCVAVLVGLGSGRLTLDVAAPMLTAVLEENSEARMLIEQPKTGVLMVHMIKPWKPMANVSKELWVINKDGKARSLGLINDFVDTKIVLADMDGKLADGMVLALSKEPLGGSPTGQPTGMVFCKGAIARMPEKTSGPRPQI